MIFFPLTCVPPPLAPSPCTRSWRSFLILGPPIGARVRRHAFRAAHAEVGRLRHIPRAAQAQPAQCEERPPSAVLVAGAASFYLCVLPLHAPVVLDSLGARKNRRCRRRTLAVRPRARAARACLLVRVSCLRAVGAHSCAVHFHQCTPINRPNYLDSSSLVVGMAGSVRVGSGRGARVILPPCRCRGTAWRRPPGSPRTVARVAAARTAATVFQVRPGGPRPS